MPARSSRRPRHPYVLLIAAVALLRGPAAAATPTYQLALIGTLRTSGAGASYAYALNDSGAVTGSAASDDGGQNVFLRTPAGVMHDAGAIVSAYDSHGMSINSAGEVAGYGSTQSIGFGQAFRILPGTYTVSPLARLAGGGDALLSSVSDSGVAVGWGNTASGCGSPPCAGNPGHAVKWQADGSTALLPALGGYYSAATGISRDGTKICGYAANAAGQTRGFVLAGSVATELAPLPGYDVSYAWSVNRFGVAVGHSENSSTHLRRATLWSGGVATDLGVLPGSTGSVAWHIADTGRASGWLENGASYLAATFSASGPPVDLNAQLASASAWTLQNAFGSNASGQVCGYADSANVSHAFLLTPTSAAGVAPGGGPPVLALACASRIPVADGATLAFSLPGSGRVRLEVLDVAGRRVAVLVDGERPAGPNAAAWDARDARGRALGAGVYLARLTAGPRSVTTKLVLAR